ncbi:PHP domain-containing protein [Euzebya tangerina]|uniref:PHP domain-containing protein n=1 Tax=Euzebya tangerina TaxID=591198 RepID=UPI000E31690A|nr:PHP domain-containing protein [Euzebya tangerina]
MPADLHTHTTYSDGLAGPYDLARMAWASGLTGLAITDHDTVAHFEESSQACSTFGLEWIPGVELSAEVPQPAGVDGPAMSVHVLGLWVRDDDNPLTRELRRLRTARRDRAVAMAQRVNQLGGAVDVERLLGQADRATLGRPHVARAMVLAGVVPTVGQAFKQYLREGGPAYVPKGALGPVQAVELIRAAGGAAVLAHPTWGGVDSHLLDAMCTAGLAGIESPRQAYEPEAADAWARTAARRDLILTCSSDFHGEAQSASMGADSTHDAMVSALRFRAGGELSQW